MNKYIIKTIHSDGYERFAVVKELEHDVNLVVHFWEYDEYLETGEESKKKKIGDLLEGNLSIGLVTNSQKVDEELFYYQEIQNSSHIEAIVEVIQIVDEYAVYALSSILDKKILIEFESAVDYKVGDKISIIGSLEMADKDN